MDENALLLLGLLRMQSQHGYQMNEFIETNLGRLTAMKKPTAYATLDRLHRQGDVAVQTEQQGNFPARKVYSITPDGEAHFFALLRTSLSAVPLLHSTTDVGILFLDELPLSEAIMCLTERLTQLDALIAMHERAPTQGYGVNVDLALEQFLVLLRANQSWLQSVLYRLKRDR
ncbi:MAG: PadR family transcriptional regulator [Thermomicrobiales bacterium]